MWRYGIRRRISIHAPRTGSDSAASNGHPPGCHFNPRSPHGERRVPPRVAAADSGEFQSTLPARGATRFTLVNPPQLAISIHAPRTGSDLSFCDFSPAQARFQSTLPARGATFQRRNLPNLLKFQSTLPARGATLWFCRVSAHTCNFNPRSPHGERPAQHPDSPRGGHFNPRSPHGERPRPTMTAARSRRFQSTLPARGATTGKGRKRPRKRKFQSTLPARGATKYCKKAFSGIGFQSTLPARGATPCQ